MKPVQVSNELLLRSVAQAGLSKEEWHRFLAWLDESCPVTPGELVEQQDGGA
jgi:hypothetical protein